MKIVAHLRAQRAALELEAKKNAPAAAPVDAKPVHNVDAFVALGVKDKVAQAHFEAFNGALPELQQLSAKAAQLDPQVASQFKRAMQLFLGELGKQLDKMEPGHRAMVLKQAITCLTQVANMATPENLIPALSLLTALNADCGKTWNEYAALSNQSNAFVQNFLRNHGSKTGARSALFALRNICEEAGARHTTLNAQQKAQTWQQIEAFLTQTSERGGFSLAGIARQTARFSAALSAQPKAPLNDVALASQAAIASANAVNQTTRDAAIEKIKLAPANGNLGHFPVVQQTLERIVTSAPHETPAFYAAAVKIADECRAMVEAGQDDSMSGAWGLAHMLNHANATTQIAHVLRFFADKMPLLLHNAQSRALLAQANQLQSTQHLPRWLVMLTLATYGLQPANLSLNALNQMDGQQAEAMTRAMMALLPLLPHVQAGNLFNALFVEAQNGSNASELESFAQRFMSVAPALSANAAYLPLAATIARVTKSKLPGDQATRMVEVLNTFAGTAAQIPLADIIAPSADGSPGLLGFKNKKAMIRDTLPFVQRTFAHIANNVADGPTRIALARKVIHAAVELSRLDRDTAQVEARLTEDIGVAIKDPTKLSQKFISGDALAIQGQGQRTLGGFLKNNDTLPPELLFTAGANLTDKQITWLSNTIENSPNRAYVRSLRDAVFAAVDGKQLFFVQTLVASKDKTAVRNAVELAAELHRRGGSVPFTQIIEGLVAGENPAAALIKKTQEEAAKSMAAGLAGVVVSDADGAAQVEKMKAYIAALTAFTSQPAVWENVSRAPYKATLEEITKSLVEGRYHAMRYTGPIAERQLKGLSPEQIAIWQRSVTVTNAAPPPPAPTAPVKVAGNEKQQDALDLAQGINAALSQVDLTGVGFETIKWDIASRDVLRAERDQLVTTVKAAAKGSPEHKDAAHKLDALHERLRLLEFFCTVDQEKDPLSVPEFLRTLAPVAETAARAATGGLRDALLEVSHTGRGVNEAPATPPASATPTTGVRAIDTDRFEHTFSVYDSGCLGPAKNHNGPALLEFIRSANHKTLLSFDAQDRPAARGQMRLLPFKQGTYDGYAVFIDKPMDAARGAQLTEEAQILYLRAGLRKAKELGVPAVFGQPMPAQYIQKAAAAEGGTVQPAAQGTMKMDFGFAGTFQTEHLGVYWSKAANANTPADINLVFTRVEMPK